MRDAIPTEAEKLVRTFRARALRAIRRVDRPLARFSIKRWKDNDERSKALSDAFMYGFGLCRVEHVPARDFIAAKEAVGK